MKRLAIGAGANALMPRRNRGRLRLQDRAGAPLGTKNGRYRRDKAEFDEFAHRLAIGLLGKNDVADYQNRPNLWRAAQDAVLRLNGIDPWNGTVFKALLEKEELATPAAPLKLLDKELLEDARRLRKRLYDDRDNGRLVEHLAWLRRHPELQIAMDDECQRMIAAAASSPD